MQRRYEKTPRRYFSFATKGNFISGLYLFLMNSPWLHNAYGNLLIPRIVRGIRQAGNSLLLLSSIRVCSALPVDHYCLRSLNASNLFDINSVPFLDLWLPGVPGRYRIFPQDFSTGFLLVATSGPQFSGSPGGSDSKESACQCRRPRFDPLVGKIPWRRKWPPTLIFFPGKSQRQKRV